MKLRVFFAPVFSLLLIGSTVLLTSAGKKEGDYDWLKARLDVSKAFTIEVINAMPDGKFSYKPDDDVRSFKAQVYHVIYSIDYYHRVFKGNPQAAWKPGDENSKSKAELLKWAEEQFDAMNATILAAPSDDGLTSGIISYLDHNAHHRGQMVSYLRMSGVTPPSYR